LESALRLFKSWADVIKKVDSIQDPEIQKLSNQLKSHATKIQKREYPLLREEFARILGRELWIDNIYVSVSTERGMDSHTSINLTGGTFASNRNIQKYTDDLRQQLAAFRFFSIHFRWYRGQRDYELKLTGNYYRDEELGNVYWSILETSREIERRRNARNNMR